jgi:hypothetical protein
MADAIDKAYGQADQPETCRGYLHLLDAKKFVHEPGLGLMETITRDESANAGKLVLNRRAALDSLIESGAVRIRWSP